MFLRLFSASSTVLRGRSHVKDTFPGRAARAHVRTGSTYVRKSLTSSTVSSPVESRVRSAQLRGESRGVSTMGDDRALGGSSVCPVGINAESEAARCFYIWMIEGGVLLGDTNCL